WTQGWMRYQERSSWTTGSARLARSAGGRGSDPRSAGLAPTLLTVLPGRGSHLGHPARPQRVQWPQPIEPGVPAEQEGNLSPGVKMLQRGERLGQAGQHALLVELPDRVEVGAATQRQSQELPAFSALLNR